MNLVGICFSTKDRVELSERSIEPLLQPDKFDLWIVDGSRTDEGKAWPWGFHKGHSPLRIVENIRGGADAAIVHNLSFLLAHEQYTHVGIVENDVLLRGDWFDRTMGLFDAARQDSLECGAASARCYADRILVQRDGYAVMHNLGAGMVIYTRAAAELILRYYRTGWTTHNRAVFSILSQTDIGRYWAFRGGEHWLTADWHFDTILAAHGLASCALTPSACEMIGQNPPLAEQGLELVDKEIDEFRLGDAFRKFRAHTALVRDGTMRMPDMEWFRERDGELIFAHQLHTLGGTGLTDRDWGLHWYQGFGPFAWVATNPPATLAIPVFGPCNVLIRGKREGEGVSRIKIVDTYSGYEVEPPLQPGIMGAINMPAGQTYRTIRLTALDAGATFHGVQCALPQPRTSYRRFSYDTLPKPVE